MVGKQSSNSQDNNVDTSVTKIAKQTVISKTIKINLSSKIINVLPHIRRELDIPLNINDNELDIWKEGDEEEPKMNITNSFTTAGVIKNSTIYINYLLKSNKEIIKFEYTDLDGSQNNIYLSVDMNKPIKEQLDSIKAAFGINVDNKYIKLEAENTPHKNKWVGEMAFKTYKSCDWNV